MMDKDLSRYVEVVEAGNWRRANDYLTAGYELIAVLSNTRERRLPDVGANQGLPYVVRYHLYVLGRMANVAPTTFARDSGAPASTEEASS